ncbi:hypothetical protein [Nocardia nova]|uniref:hypothetical protein n=1 Tax=Nocardia nova TaxID=37330 RepID=UPI00340FDBB1
MTIPVESEHITTWVERLSAAAEQGKPIDLAEGCAAYSTGRSRAGGRAWGPERQIPAAALRTVLINRNLAVDPHGIHIRAAWISGPVDLENVEFEHALHLRGCRIEHLIDLSGSTLKELNLNGSHIQSLALDGATITGTVFAGEGFTATGEIHALEARIGGQLALRGARLANPGGVALRLDRAMINGDVFADDGFTATGEIRATSANIGGQLSLNGATLANRGGVALCLDQATINGDVFADDGFTATGEIRAIGANIGGGLSLTNATLTNPGGAALNLDQAMINGSVIADKGLTAIGEVRAGGARIDGQLILNGATLKNPDGVALDLESSVITTLTLTPAQVDGTTDLTRATIIDLHTPPNTQPPGQLIATGWQITDVHGLIRTDRRAATQWLKSTAPGHGFTAQPWHALATVYDRNGQPVDARRLRFIAAKQTTKYAPRSTKPLSWMYLAIAGHGYYPLRAAAWLAGALLVGIFITELNTEHFIPVDRAAAIKSAAAHATETHTPPPRLITAAEPCSSYPDYPCFSAFNYNLAGVVPAATGVSKSDWTIASTAPVLLTSTFTALRFFAWIFTAILLAGVTGLLRKT